MAEDLGIAGERSMLTALHAGGAKPLVLGIEHIAAAPNNRARARFIAKKVFPSPAALRKESALARRGAAGLALAYVWRPASRVVRLPGAIAAWRAARRLRSADR
jgi:hypothetical protein